MAKDTTGEPLTMAFSLLWPKGRQQSGALPLEEGSAADLDVDKLVKFIAADSKNETIIRNVFKHLCQDSGTINYRLDVLEDLSNSPALTACWESLVPVLSEMRYYTSHRDSENWSELIEVVWRLRELEHYVRCVTDLNHAFSGLPGLRSEGLRKLKDLVAGIEKDPTFHKLKQELPALLTKINNLKSITLGVNLNAGMAPYQATLVSINSHKYSDGPLYDKLIGKSEFKGIAPLHKAPDDSAYTNPLMIPIFRDIADIMRKAVRPLAKALREFLSINSWLLIKLQEDFLFYLGAAKVVEGLRGHGIPMTRPEVADKDERVFEAREMYNINLAIHLLRGGAGRDDQPVKGIITNDFSLGDRGRIAIITGPNRGGKTTILQAVGLCQIMLQVGLYVPASQARISPADNIFTHYPAKEELERGTGRFGEEAQRLRDLFGKATRSSLVLLNETLSSTSMGESLFLAADLVRVLRLMGARVLYTTHLHQLAANIERINESTRGDSLLFSLVAMVKKEPDPDQPPGPDGRPVEKITPTFKIVPGPPEGQSYAVDLARRFGISLAQLVNRLKERGEL